jgi:hypothetical protein
MKALRYTATKVGQKTKIVVKVELADDCKNGVCDFSITCVGYRKAKNGVWVDDFGGCAHDEILKRFPQFADFVRLHLSNSKGVPMYAVEKGRYILETEGVEKCADYLRISVELAQQLDCSSKEHFKYQLFALGIVDAWQKEAEDAIKHLEELCGYSFEDYETPSPYFSLELTEEERKDVERKIAEGFFTTEQVAKRKEEKERRERDEKRLKIERYYTEKIEEYTAEREIMLAIFDTFGTEDNVIYYKRSRELAFNWTEPQFATYKKKWTIEEFRRFNEEQEDIVCKYNLLPVIKYSYE